METTVSLQQGFSSYFTMHIRPVGHLPVVIVQIFPIPL